MTLIAFIMTSIVFYLKLLSAQFLLVMNPLYMYITLCSSSIPMQLFFFDQTGCGIWTYIDLELAEDMIKLCFQRKNETTHCPRNLVNNTCTITEEIDFTNYWLTNAEVYISGQVCWDEAAREDVGGKTQGHRHVARVRWIWIRHLPKGSCSVRTVDV